MDQQRRKELREQWDNRHPEMGVVAMTCKATNEQFLAVVKDTSVGFNRHRFQLSARMHPNRRLQTLWNEHGEDGFSFDVVSVLKYDNPHDDHSDELAKLLEKYMEAHPDAVKM